MKKIKKLPLSTLVLTLMGVGLLLFGTVGGARSALTYFTTDYGSQFDMYDIGIMITESNDYTGGVKEISYRNYANEMKQLQDNWNMKQGDLLEEFPEEIEVGKVYPEVLGVTNSGEIDEFVRVRIFRYWTDNTGKRVDLDPALIKLEWSDNFDASWLIDTKETGDSKETTVMYYRTALPSGASTAAITKSVAIDIPVAAKITETSETKDGYTTITRTYDYDGLKFNIEIEADGVQTHNAHDAMLSAWGRNITVSGNTITGFGD